MFLFYFYEGCYGGALVFLGGAGAPASPSLAPPMVMLILMFNSTAYCHAHSFILYILYSVLYFLFLFILFHAYFPCVVFYNICTVHGAFSPDTHFTAGYTISV